MSDLIRFNTRIRPSEEKTTHEIWKTHFPPLRKFLNFIILVVISNLFPSFWESCLMFPSQNIFYFEEIISFHLWGKLLNVIMSQNLWCGTHMYLSGNSLFEISPHDNFFSTNIFVCFVTNIFVWFVTNMRYVWHSHVSIRELALQHLKYLPCNMSSAWFCPQMINYLKLEV